MLLYATLLINLLTVILTGPVVDEDGMRPSNWLGVDALCFLRCFDTVGWLTGINGIPLVRSVQLLLKDSFPEHVEDENG